MKIVRYGLIVIGMSLLLGGGYLLFRYSPADCVFFPPCIFHKLTGLHCPGCGTTRALHALLHGDIVTAMSMNPLMILSIPLLVYLVSVEIIYRKKKKPILNHWYIWALFVIIVLYWIARNIPLFPFTLLAPG